MLWSLPLSDIRTASAFIAFSVALKRFFIDVKDVKFLSLCNLILAIVLTTALPALADDGSAPSQSAEGANTVPGADKVDEVLTNANLRAYAGSKSRWSMSNAINYDGGTISAPFAEGRPNIANASATSTDTDINDQVSLKYSIDPLNSLLLGIGVRKMAPFTFSGPSSAFYAQGGKDMDMYDPSLAYQYVYRFFGVQAVAQVAFTQYTRADIHSPDGGNLDKQLYFDQENMYEIGNLSVGGSIGVSGNMPTNPGLDYSRYQFWFDPYIEYKVADSLSLRTVANIWSYEYYPTEKLVRDVYTQSVGIGWSVSRDVYLYPNLQFLPDHVSKDYTNVGLAATINLF